MIPAHEERSLRELKDMILQTVKVRRVTLGIFLLLALYFRFGAGLNFPLPLIFSPLMWSLMTLPFSRLVKSQDTKESLNNVHFGYFLVELLILTYLIHIIGGAEWIGVAYYAFTILYANFFLPTKKAWTITVSAVVFFAGISYAELAGLIPHWSIFDDSKPLYKNSFYVTTTVLAGGVGLYFTTAYTVQIFADLFQEKNESLREREFKLQKLWKELISVREEERKRISKRIHDQLGQTLMGVKMKLDILHKESNDPGLKEVKDLISEAITESRNLSHLLRPSMLDELGLAPSIRELVDSFDASSDVVFNVSLDPSSKVESEERRIILYRATQELLSNSLKHGNPSRINVELDSADSRIYLVVEDDGKGFDPDTVSKESGLGLKGIQENITIAGGDFDISSEEGTGTRAEIKLPLD